MTKLPIVLWIFQNIWTIPTVLLAKKSKHTWGTIVIRKIFFEKIATFKRIIIWQYFWHHTKIFFLRHYNIHTQDRSERVVYFKHSIDSPPTTCELVLGIRLGWYQKTPYTSLAHCLSPPSQNINLFNIFFVKELFLILFISCFRS